MKNQNKIYFLFFTLFLSVTLVSAYDFPSTVVTIDYSGNLTNLSELYDTNIPSPTNGQALTYSSSTSKWIASTITAITDTNASTECSGTDYLAGNGSCLSVSAIGGDTNETTRVNEISQNWCAGSVLVGFYSNGTGICETDDTGGSGGGNTTEEMQDAIASALDSNFTYVDGSDLITVNPTNLAATLQTVLDSVYHPLWDYDFADLINVAITTLEITDGTILVQDLNLSNFTSWDTDVSDDFDGDWTSLINIPSYLNDGADNDTNAETICATDEVLLGNGTCLSSSNFGVAITYTNGTGISLEGTEFNHSDTSSVSNSDNSGNTFIQDLTFDAFGHVLSVTAAAVDLSAYYLSSEVDTLINSLGNYSAENSTILKIDTALSGEVSGTYDNLVVGNGVLDDQYLEQDAVNIIGGNLTVGNYALLNQTSGDKFYHNGTCWITQSGTTKFAVCP